MAAASKIPKKVLLPGTLEALDRPKTGEAQQLTIEEWRKTLRSWISGLESWMLENKERALDLLVEFHDVFALEDGEMVCTEATEHHIEVTNPHPFKERPRNIPKGLRENTSIIC